MANGPTSCGFRWGPMSVIRACSDARYRTLLVYTDYHEVEITVSRTGRAVHVTQRDLRSPPTQEAPR